MCIIIGISAKISQVSSYNSYCLTCMSFTCNFPKGAISAKNFLLFLLQVQNYTFYFGQPIMLTQSMFLIVPWKP